MTTRYRAELFTRKILAKTNSLDGLIKSIRRFEEHHYFWRSWNSMQPSTARQANEQCSGSRPGWHAYPAGLHPAVLIAKLIGWSWSGSKCLFPTFAEIRFFFSIHSKSEDVRQRVYHSFNLSLKLWSRGSVPWQSHIYPDRSTLSIGCDFIQVVMHRYRHWKLKIILILKKKPQLNFFAISSQFSSYVSKAMAH